jgi:hypothetical protein
LSFSVGHNYGLAKPGDNFYVATIVLLETISYPIGCSIERQRVRCAVTPMGTGLLSVAADSLQLSWQRTITSTKASFKGPFRFFVPKCRPFRTPEFVALLILLTIVL